MVETVPISSPVVCWTLARVVSYGKLWLWLAHASGGILRIISLLLR